MSSHFNSRGWLGRLASPFLFAWFSHAELCTNWLQSSVLLFCITQRESAFEEIEQQLSKDKLTFEVFHSTLESSYLLVIVFNRADLALLMPTLIWQHNDCMSTFWSPHKHAFTIEKKIWDAKEYPKISDTICINFNQPTTAFWFGHDFHGTDIFSNEEKYAKLEDVQKRLPSFIKTEVIEFG